MRIPSLDVMRGLIIVLMAIDHARAFVAKNHPGEFWGRPLPDYGGDVLAFVTRLISHPCAPGFFFLMAVIGRFFPAGTTLPAMYLFWLMGLVLLYFPCRWYGAFKRTRPASSLLRML